MRTKTKPKSKNTALVAFKEISHRILEIRGQTVMLDADLAEIYGVQTKRLNEQVKRNIERFPEDFMFKLTKDELSELVANCDRFKNLKHSTSLPNAFTEHGALMLASVLKSDIAIHASLEIVRAFVKMREMILANKDLAKKIASLESRLTKHDGHFKIVFDALRDLMQASHDQVKKPVGFHVNMPDEQKAKVIEKANELVKEMTKLNEEGKLNEKAVKEMLKKSGVIKKWSN
jgi:hypothetical protein